MLPEGSVVSGQIRDGDVNVPYALVEVRDWANGRAIGMAYTDAEGAFALRIDPDALAAPDDTGNVDTGGDDTGG